MVPFAGGLRDEVVEVAEVAGLGRGEAGVGEWGDRGEGWRGGGVRHDG